MEDNQNTEENTFSAEEVEKIIQEAIEALLPGVQYDEKLVQHWINTLCEKITFNLVELGKPYKLNLFLYARYITNCMIMQRNGAGTFVTNSAYWDTVADGSVIVSWPKDKQAKQEQ